MSMDVKPHVSACSGILHQLCPRCRIGRIYPASIFRGFPKMNERCTACGLKFEREEGYFLGAMAISYALAVALVAALAALLWVATSWSLERAVLVAFVPLALLAPSLAKFSRVLWIYFDRSVDPTD